MGKQFGVKNLRMKTLPYFVVRTVTYMDFPGGAVVKNPSANAGDTRDVSSIPGLERFPEEGSCKLF